MSDGRKKINLAFDLIEMSYQKKLLTLSDMFRKLEIVKKKWTARRSMTEDLRGQILQL